MIEKNNQETRESQNGLSDRLISIYEKALQIDSKDKLLLIDLGNLYEEKGMFKKAIELYEKSIKLGADENLINHFLVRVYEEEEVYEKAVAIYERMLAKDPYNIIATESLSRLYLKLKKPDFERAKSMMEMSKNIGFVGDLKHMAEEKEERKLFDSAIDIYTQIIKIDNKYSLAYNKIAKIYRVKGDISKAIRYYEMSIKFNKENVNAYVWLGILYALCINKEEAIRKLKTVINKKMSRSINAIAKSIYNYVKSEDYIMNNKSDQNAEIRKKGREIEKAMYNYEGALKRNEEDWLSHFYLGVIYFIKDLFDKSRIEFRALMRINPQSSEAKLISLLKNDIMAIED
ncbi:MAG: tetratricopeptide repeat protein [bacterium]|nr:tetratricopeptide repeat protein [bacterium]